MKNKNKIKEDDVTKGSDGTGDMPSKADTSATTDTSSSSKSISTKPNPEGTLYVKWDEENKTKVKQAIKNAKQNKMDVKIVNESEMNTPMKLEYLSEIKDVETGEMSKPFTIADKKYQMVRAMTPDRQKVMGVYCMDEVDDEGNNIIHDVKHFEENIAKKAIQETGVVEPDGPEAATLMGLEEKKETPSFEGHKHFIVNQKTGKARKFKSIEELAKAKMGEDEKYMGIREFKKFVDEALFGTRKKNRVEELTTQPGGEDLTAQPSGKNKGVKDGKVVNSAKRLMDFIQAAPKVSDNIERLKSAKNPTAIAQVISLFAELVGVPKGKLSQVISSIKDTAKSGQQQQQAQEPAPVTERRIIKVKDIK
jgi:hypothetical protein